MTYLGKIGDVVQIDPKANLCFGGCYMVIDQVSDNGTVRGYVLIPYKDGARRAHFRASLGEVIPVGPSPFYEFV